MRAAAGAAGAPAGAAGRAPQPAGAPLPRPRPPTSPQSMLLARARVHSPTGYRNAGEHPGPHTSPPASGLRPSGVFTQGSNHPGECAVVPGRATDAQGWVPPTAGPGLKARMTGSARTNGNAEQASSAHLTNGSARVLPELLHYLT